MRPGPYPRRTGPGLGVSRHQARSRDLCLSAAPTLADTGPDGRDSPRPPGRRRRPVSERAQVSERDGTDPAISPDSAGRSCGRRRPGSRGSPGGQGLPRGADARRGAASSRLALVPGRSHRRCRGRRADRQRAADDSRSRGRAPGRGGGGGGAPLARVAGARPEGTLRGGTRALLAARRHRQEPQRGLRLRPRDAALSFRQLRRLPQSWLHAGGVRRPHSARHQAGVHGRDLSRPVGAAARCRAAGARFETIHRRKGGSDYPVEIHLQLVDSGGRRPSSQSSTTSPSGVAPRPASSS